MTSLAIVLSACTSLTHVMLHDLILTVFTVEQKRPKSIDGLRYKGFMDINKSI
jgi:hypothetical protein